MSKPHADSELLNGRYRVLEQIARGAQGSTSKAVDEETQTTVVLKELDFAGVGDWDEVALFERESAVLAGLDHLAIPRFLDAFQVDEEDGPLRMFLVQEFVDGEDLQIRLDAGALFDEARLRAIAKDVLETLTYLHGHSPPVIHRDIKPANLIARPDGEVALVDFGAAQGHTHGAAVIGTSGYMPAEQLMGRALPVSDLYALGATLIHLATRKHPSDLGDGLGLNWRDKANLTPRFEEWLDRLVAPMPEDRFLSAASATRALEGLDRTRRPPAEPAETSLRLRGSYKSKLFDLRASGMDISLARRKHEHGIDFVWLGFLGLAGIVGTRFHLPSGLFIGVLAVFMHLYVRLFHRHVRKLHGHSRGLDVVWSGGAEIVQRISHDEIAGAEVRGAIIKDLVIWRRDGSRMLLDTSIVSRDFDEIRRGLHAWLVHVRERG